MLRRMLVPVALTTASLLAGPQVALAGTVGDGAGGGAAAIGQVTLFENADFSGRQWSISYPGCPGPSVRPVSGQVRGFDNRPAPGCRVVLSNRSWSFELCAGRGAVPAGFQDSPAVRVEPGGSVPCP